MFTTILGVLLFINILGHNPTVLAERDVVLASRSFSMENRYGNAFVNGVFKDNILLTLNYMAGTVKGKGDISWENIQKPLNYEFSLEPGQTFAFHDQIAPKYDKNVVKTTNAHFNYADGFKSDGYLMGDGVCHFASLIYWAAKDAGLATNDVVPHDFAKINEVPREYGVSIYAAPENFANGSRQNLYITNSLEKPVDFVFDFDGTNLTVKVTS